MPHIAMGFYFTFLIIKDAKIRMYKSDNMINYRMTTWTYIIIMIVYIIFLTTYLVVLGINISNGKVNILKG